MPLLRESAMTINTTSISGESILWTMKEIGLPVPKDAECQFVRVDQNTREVFIDYLTQTPSPSSQPNESAWREVVSYFKISHLWEGLRRVRRDAIASTRQPNLRPPGCTDEWYTSR